MCISSLSFILCACLSKYHFFYVHSYPNITLLYVHIYPDITEYDAGLTSVNISFTVPYFLEEEEYYIIYGFNPDELYSTSDPIMSVSDTSLENQTYTIHIEGLEAGTIYYAQVVAVFGVSGESQRYSNDTTFRTKENGIHFNKYQGYGLKQL